MPVNPLQQYFRQPKIYISLPSNGAYSKPGVLTGDLTNMPVYGMTGMDEIIIKTPDALLSGESTVKVIESCCPSVKDGWEISNLDLDLILTAIRIATYGNTISINHVCEHCETENEYDLELSKLIDHFNTVKFDNKVVLKDITIRLQPLTYKQLTEFNQRNFQLQQKLNQIRKIENDDERNTAMSELYLEFGQLQTEVYLANIEAVEAGNQVVDQKDFIKEWLTNAEKSIYDQLREQIDKNREEWKSPPQPVKCEHCEKENLVKIELDHSTFFANA